MYRIVRESNRLNGKIQYVIEQIWARKKICTDR